MSRNLILEAKYPATKKREAMEFQCSLFQTPDGITDKALQSADPKTVYLEWVERMFADDYDFVKEHSRKINAFLREHKDKFFWGST